MIHALYYYNVYLPHIVTVNKFTQRPYEVLRTYMYMCPGTYVYKCCIHVLGVPYPFTFHHYTHYPETLNSIDVWSFIEFVIPEDIMQISINTTSFLHHGHPF